MESALVRLIIQRLISCSLYIGVLLLGLALLTSGASAQAQKTQPALESDNAKSPLPVTVQEGTGVDGTMGLTPTCSPNWKIWPSDNTNTGISTLNAVAALAANDVWAVGGYIPSGATSKYKTLIMHWNGSEWSIVQSPNIGEDNNQLNAVFAYAANDVWAVGYYRDATLNANRTFTVHWNGTNWSTITSPTEGNKDNVLNAVIKLPSGKVWAAGYFVNTSNVRKNLMLEWNGSAWVTRELVNQGAYDNELHGLAVVPGTNEAWAVGFYETDAGGTQSQLLTMRLTNDNWNLVTATGPGSKHNKLYGVSATGTGDAWAVGSYEDTGEPVRTLTLHWNGTQWDDVSSPSGDGNTVLFSVVALAPNNAWAVGTRSTGFLLGQPYIVRWDGTQWTDVQAPEPGNGGYLRSVAAIGSNDIWAVQLYFDSDNMVRPLTLHWNGTSWGVVESPEGVTNYNVLFDVAAGAPDDIWAVGYYMNDSGVYRTLTQHWDGEQWTVVPSPNESVLSNRLSAVAFVGPNDVWAVGDYEEEATLKNYGLILRWNGLTWNVVDAPTDPINDNEVFNDIAVAASNKIWLVGSAGAGSDTDPWIVHWNGLFLNIVDVPRQVNVPEELNAISLVPGTNGEEAWAVGSTGIIGETRPLFMYLSNDSWSKVDALQAAEASLEDVVAISSGDVWAVGIEFTTGNHTESLIAHWNGSTWSVSNSFNMVEDHGLFGVAAITANDIWAVGATGDNVSGYQTLAIHWNGSSWSSVPSESTPVLSQLIGVAAVSSDDVWAVGGGAHPSLSHIQTLIERYNPCACDLQFNDVPEGSTFYSFVRCLACQEILSGYGCGAPGEPCPGSYFRPGDNVTRGQAAKIISNAAGYTDAIPNTQQTFADVPTGSTFWLFIERVYEHGAISGYACGGAGEPCDAQNRGYFRPGAKLTRAQLAKITTSVAGYNETPSGQSFNDVPPGSPFYEYIERALAHGVSSGYGCGAPGEPCPGAYFRPGSNVTRGQTAKIVSNTFFPGCETLARPR